MASSRASSTPGSRRSTKRDGVAKPTPRKRSGTTHKATTAKKPAAKKPAPKKTAPKRSAPKSQARPKPKTKSASARPKKSSVRSVPTTPGHLLSRALKIALAVGAITLALAATYWFWFRESSFVAVEEVAVEGIEGPEAEAVTETLTRAASKMTTLNVDEGELAAAVSGFPTVVAIQTESDFPHGLTVDVTGRPPVLAVSDGGPPVPIAADGTILNGVDITDAGLPVLQVESVPVKGALEGEPLALAQVAGAAPDPLRPLIKDLAINPGEGIEVTLKGGIPARFGDPDQLEEKWTAVSAVLANPQVKTLTHLDVRVPERPSIGGAAPALKGG